MIKTTIATTILMCAFAAPAFAESHIEPYPGLEGLDCVALVEKLDVTLEDAQMPDELKSQVIELREEGIIEKDSDNEEACVTSLTAAFQLLMPQG